MSIRVLQILAGLFALAAVLLVLVGWRLASSVSQPAPAISSSSSVAIDNDNANMGGQFPALVAVNEMSSGHLLREQDLRLVDFPFALSQGVTDSEQLVGHVLTRAVKAGNVIRAGDIESPPGMANEINAGMRAVAIAIDEVVGVGSHVSPGDQVDVHFVSDTRGIAAEPGLGRTLFNNLRVLSVGENYLLPESSDDEPVSRSARSVVLEIPEPLAPLLTLAETTGMLRLALIGQKELQENAYLAAQDEAGKDASIVLLNAGLSTGANIFRQSELTAGADMGAMNSATEANTSANTGKIIIQHVGRELTRVNIPD